MIKIGILIGEFDKLQNWELRIIKEIIDNKVFEIKLLIQDGRFTKPKSICSKIFSAISSKHLLVRTIQKVQFSIERKIYPQKRTINSDEIIEYLSKVELIQLKPERKGFIDVFSKEHSETIKKYELDVILRHEFNIIRGDILKSARYGIWSFHHADNDVVRGGPPGFWEIILGESNIGITLQELTPELDGGRIIDKAYSNISYSYIKNRFQIQEDSVSLLIKNLKKLKTNEYCPKKSITYSGPLYRSPNLRVLLVYLFKFYIHYFQSTSKKIKSRVFRKRYNRWNLFIGEGSFLEATLFRLKRIKPNRNEFWADPFIFSYRNNNYVFFENYSYTEKKGKISCGIIQGKNIVDVVDVLNLDYHLSYPFIMQEDNEIFMIPETSANKRLEVFRCIEFPHRWEPFSSAFDGELVCDAHIFKDNHNQKWLFLNKSKGTTSTDLELYIYKIDSLKLNEIIPHKQNPVIIDSRTARNGGEIFHYNNKIYRPSQYNGDGIYGRGLNINKIEKLTLDEYKEITVLKALPNFHKRLVGTHHLHQIENLFIIDGCFK